MIMDFYLAIMLKSDYFLSYATFLERDLIPAQMRFSNVSHTTAEAGGRSCCQKMEEEMKGWGAGKRRKERWRED